MVNACVVWPCLNRLATLPPNGGVLVLQVVEWMDSLTSVAQTPSQEAVIISGFQLHPLPEARAGAVLVNHFSFGVRFRADENAVFAAATVSPPSIRLP